MKSRLGDKELAHDAFFTNMKVPEVQKFLKERNIRISVNWRLLRGACTPLFFFLLWLSRERGLYCFPEA